MKRYIIIAGVNGAGKSTLYSLYNTWGDIKKINLDEIVKGIGNWKNRKDMLAAGKIAIQMINDCFNSGISLCQETTLCGKTVIRNIRRAKELGYSIEMHYVGVDSAEIAKTRVKHRVSVGGHGISEEDIERRYIESFQRLHEIIKECDLVVFYDNTTSFNRFAIARRGYISRISALKRIPKWYIQERFEIEPIDFIIRYGEYELLLEVSGNIDYQFSRISVYSSSLMWQNWKTCELMHGNNKVVTICKDGTCIIHDANMLPYNLYLENAGEDADIDIRMQNLENFYYWCSGRTISSERKYGKEILNSISASHEETEKARALRALTHNCLSLTDVYWTQAVNQEMNFAEINLYENHKGNKFINTALKGKQIPVDNPYLLASILGTHGGFPKAWIESEGQLYLIKGGASEDVEKELLASKISRCFKVNQVTYETGVYDGETYSICKIMTSLEHSIVPMEHFAIYLANKEQDLAQTVLNLDAYNYYMMNIIDYLMGNTDRHWGNWGVLVDNSTNQPIRLHDLMDFNRAFGNYDTMEGANCLTSQLVENKKQTQREAAVEAAKKIGLNQIEEVKEEWFQDEKIKEMFFARLELLRGVISK